MTVGFLQGFDHNFGYLWMIFSFHHRVDVYHYLWQQCGNWLSGSFRSRPLISGCYVFLLLLMVKKAASVPPEIV